MRTVTHWRYRLKQSLTWALVPIWGGPLRGSWFGVFTGTRFLRGTYGPDEVPNFLELIKPGDTVFDIGAHVGYFTLLASRIVGRGGRVVAFEPLPVNLAYLRRHKNVNRRRNVDILPVAVGQREGQMALEFRSGTGRGRLTTDGTAGHIHVRVVNLDALWERGALPEPDVIKMDVEGAECEALRGASRLLARCRPVILLSVHGNEARAGSQALLEELGFTATYVRKSVIVARPREADAARSISRRAA